jgi:hypothetical protein
MENVQQTTQEVKRNKFAQLISNNGDNVLQSRADKLATTAEIAQQTLINNLKNKKANLELKLIQLTDLAPTNKMDLTPNSENWDPNTWVSEVQNVKQELYQLNIQLQLAEDTFKEFFKV